ncbi:MULTISPECIES: HBL/NHE enterotoxin family protein [Bacillus]|uniref:non-hemolytic enterotoxin subunit C n=1 Tax=Bacillus TaxID=1386 RepID=UPI0004683DB8|nr:MULTISPECIES: HBL/NHE enterotoxin family protein [Bacillus]MED1409878.1 HBL/NHE enterotoxin family protein [Bacillus paramycoides]MED1465040.1 HBL/NHE enterotoxin family protein [Bacillus paramycoides]MED1493567.1 HBL/NHE enterotoxin family protein [Bacillus paramycoides]
MRNNFYKKCLLTIMIAGVATSNAVPLHPLAAEQNVKTLQENAENYSLGPAGFQDVMAQTTSSIFAMDSYAKLIQNEQETDLSKISSINGELRGNMIQHQKDAKINAAYWLNEMKPQIMKTDQNIIDFNNTFQTYYNRLLSAIDQKDSVKLKADLEKLYADILKNQNEVDVLLGNLKAYRDRMTKDTNSFKEDSNQLTAILASTNAGIPALEQQINTYNDSIKKSNDMVIAGGVLCVALITCLAGGPMIAIAKKDIANAEREIASLKNRISGAQAEVAILTDVKNKTTNMTETIDAAITALQNISNQWYTVGAKYNNLLQNVKGISPEEFTFIKEDLNTAKDSWTDVKNYTEKLHEGVTK